MTDTNTANDAKAAVASATPSDGKSVKSKQKVAKPARRGSLLAGFNFLLTLAVALFVFWVWQQRFVEHGVINAGVDQVSAANEVLASKLDGIENTLDILSERQQVLELALSDLTVLQEQINRVESDLKGVSSSDRLVWQLEELGFLLRMARERVLLSNDVRGASALLASADRQLKEMNNLDLQPVRAALARDMMALSAAAQIDTSGLFSRVRALSERVPHLTLKPELFVTTENAEVQNELSTFDRILQLIDIRTFDRSVVPILAPEERYYVTRNLELMLEESIMALFQQNDELWKTSLSRASDWVANHFDDNAEQRAIMSGLSALAAQSISMRQLDIGDAEAALESYRLKVDATAEEDTQ